MKNVYYLSALVLQIKCKKKCGSVGMVSYTHVVYVTCYFCYVFSLGPSSGRSGSVRIYRRVIFGKQN
jgi:hypothetical protein